MTSTLAARRLLRDSLPIPVILAVWLLPSRFPPAGTGQALLVGGVAMALLYVAVRGAGLASRCGSAAEPADVAAILEENVRVLAAAAVPFVAAQALWYAFSSPLGILPDLRYLEVFGVAVSALNGMGAGIVLLYAVAVGRARLAAGPTEPGPVDGPTGGRSRPP